MSADYTVLFQVPKLSFFLPECYRYVGAWTLVDIGLSKDFFKTAETKYQAVTLKSARRLLRSDRSLITRARTVTRLL